jgi:hypothetical protein
MTAAIPDDAMSNRIAAWFPSLADRRRYRCHTDATDFYRVSYGDVLILADRAYLILNNAKEGRFGLDDQEKFWVKRAVDLESGQRKIIKLVFFEAFTAHIGDTAFDCFRSPRKEARILEKVAGHPHFMHGFATTDSRGNIIRVLDFIYGKSLFDTIEDLPGSHETYFLTDSRTFSTILKPASKQSAFFTIAVRNTGTSGGITSLSTVKAATTGGSISTSITATVKTSSDMIFSVSVTS